MLGERSSQRGMFEADHLYLGFVGEGTFYGFLARHRGELFRDEDFAEFYSPDWGRPSVPPSLLATALLLQTHDRVSDEEAKARADYDLRWKVALGVEVDARPFAKSTLQLFRAQLVLKEKMRAVFRRSLEYARQSGYLNNAQAAGSAGHDLHPGSGRGEGHLQPAGGQHTPTAQGAGRGGGPRTGGLGYRAWVCAVHGCQHQRRSSSGLGQRAVSLRVPERDRP